MDSQSEQQRHQGIALFAAFALRDRMWLPLIVCPNVFGRRRVRQAHEGQGGSRLWQGGELSKHSGTPDVVESADAVDAEHAELGVQVARGAEEVANALRPGSGGQGVLKRPARFLD